MKTENLSGVALDWAVAKCENKNFELVESFLDYYDEGGMHYADDWAMAGPIIEREGITIVRCSGDLGEPRTYWSATSEMQAWHWGYGPFHEPDEDKSIQIYASQTIKGPTPLIAAMRCYVASKLGDDVDIPRELQ